jgi:hypothetical protein
LTGAFIVIALGLSLSLLAFLYEQINFITNRRRKRTQNDKITVESTSKTNTYKKQENAQHLKRNWTDFYKN